MSKIIIIEGYDCTGKSTLAEVFKRALENCNLRVNLIKSGGVPKCTGEVIHWVNKLYEAKNDDTNDITIFDRHVMFSSEAYLNDIFCHTEDLIPNLRHHVLADTELDFLYINCQIHLNVLCTAMAEHVGKDYDSNDHLKLISSPEFITEAVERYSGLIYEVETASMTVAHYDRTECSPYDFVSSTPNVADFLFEDNEPMHSMFYDAMIDIDVEDFVKEADAA